MYYTYLALVLAIFYLDAALLVQAGLYIIQPSAGSECQAGSPCTISWLDDGTNPLLSAVGVSRVGLYTGRQQLVQTIAPVDVSSARSITFTPNADAGPNSDSYYIAIISTTLERNDSAPYSGFSPYFSLVGMNGSFDTPLPAATSPLPIPSTPPRPSSTKLRTITVGTLSTAISSPVVKPSVTPPSVSLTSTTPPTSTPPPTTTPASTSSAPTSSSTKQNSSTSGAGRSASHLPSPLLAVGLLLASSFCFTFS